MKMNDEELEKAKHSILHDNRILYCMRSRSCTETCMCWGLEINQGWISAVDEMSKSLEALNYIFYPKFRVRVQMDQVKEKWGTLHAYYTVVADPPKWMCIWHSLFQKIFDRIRRLDFKKAEVFDKDEYDEVVEKELATREEFEEEKKTNNCSNVEVFEQDGKFIRKATYHHYKKTHFVPTKHKWLFKILMKRYVVENFPIDFFRVKTSHMQECICSIVDEKARAIVQKAEKDCYNVCEHCGKYISDDSEYSPRCTTRGWIAYLCKDCANESGQQYIMNGAIWQNGKETMSKEEYSKKMSKSLECEDYDESEVEGEDKA